MTMQLCRTKFRNPASCLLKIGLSDSSKKIRSNRGVTLDRSQRVALWQLMTWTLSDGNPCCQRRWPGLCTCAVGMLVNAALPLSIIWALYECQLICAFCLVTVTASCICTLTLLRRWAARPPLQRCLLHPLLRSNTVVHPARDTEGSHLAIRVFHFDIRIVNNCHILF